MGGILSPYSAGKYLYVAIELFRLRALRGDDVPHLELESCVITEQDADLVARAIASVRHAQPCCGIALLLRRCRLLTTHCGLTRILRAAVCAEANSDGLRSLDLAGCSRLK